MIFLKKCLLTALLLVGAVCLGFPQEEGKEDPHYKVKKKEVVVVTATLTRAPVQDVALSLNVLEKSDILRSSSASALDILARTAGIFVNRSGDFGRADVDIRGLGQNCRRVAVLVDGKPEKMGLFGCAVSHAFPLDNVERIEAVKGPASVLYGGEAMGGAINIITHTPQRKAETSLSASYGSFNTRQLNLRHGGRLRAFRYYFTFDNRASSGHVANSDYSGRSLTGKLVYDLSPGSRLTLQSKYFDGEKYEPGTIDHPLTDFWNRYKRGAVSLAFNRKWSKTNFHVNLYRNFGKHRFSDGFDSRDFTSGAAVRFTTRAIPRNELTMGGDLRFFGGRSFGYPVGKWDKHEGSVFFHNRTALAGGWIVYTGVRLQMDSLYGTEWCPQLGVVYQLSSATLLRGVISKGFRSPQINELYMYPPANQELEPERLWNYEAGIEQRLGRGVTLKGSLFHMRGSSMILTVPNDAPPPMYIFANSGAFSFYGAEVELSMSPLKNLLARLSFSVMDYGDYTKGRPGQKADLSLQYTGKRVSAVLDCQYAGNYYAADLSQNPIPSYLLLSARLMVPVIRRLELVVDMGNILDNRYEIYGEFPGMTAGLYRMPGRSFQVGFRYRHESDE